MTDTADEIKELKVRVYDLSTARAQLDQEIGQANMKIAELTQSLNGQAPMPAPAVEAQS
jgi:hypothetical protein